MGQVLGRVFLISADLLIYMCMFLDDPELDIFKFIIIFHETNNIQILLSPVFKLSLDKNKNLYKISMDLLIFVIKGMTKK